MSGGDQQLQEATDTLRSERIRWGGGVFAGWRSPGATGGHTARLPHAAEGREDKDASRLPPNLPPLPSAEPHGEPEDAGTRVRLALGGSGAEGGAGVGVVMGKGQPPGTDARCGLLGALQRLYPRDLGRP